MNPDSAISAFLLIAGYDIMQGLAFILAASYFLIAGRRLGIGKTQLILVTLISGFVQFLGGMAIPLVYKIIMLHTPISQIWGESPGRYFHGAFLSILVYMILAAKFLKWPVRKILDELMIAAMIMSSVGRIGCWFAGCCAGKSDLFPIQITMFFCEFLIVGILLWVNKNKKHDGRTFWWGIFLYSFYRFWIEFLRTNPVFTLGLTHAQFFSIITLCVSLVVLLADFFTRDPERSIQFDDDSILSPADGRITQVSPGKISIYLSLFDVHVNRSPISGTVRSISYSPGKFRFAFDSKALTENENNLIAIANGRMEIAVRQIAGKLARRVVCYCKEGQNVKQGDRIGMIKFGSCVQICLPQNAVIRVKTGDRVRAGQTVLAVLKN